MLAKLLELIADKGIYRPEDLARRLDTTPEVVAQALEFLVKGGYLQVVEGAANSGCTSGACTSCGSGASCHISRTKMWVVTRK